MNGMIFRSFRKRNSSQKNTNTVYAEYSYSGIVPKERAPWVHFALTTAGILYDTNITTPDIRSRSKTQ